MNFSIANPQQAVEITQEKKKQNNPSGLPLFVMRPHTQDFDSFCFLDNLIN